MKKKTLLLLICFISLSTGHSQAWFDKTHIAIGMLAHFKEAYSLAAPDILKLKSENEGPNHYYNNKETTLITKQMIKKQIANYNMKTKTGNLYGAIIASVRAARDAREVGKDYIINYLAFAGHYIGDLSNPLHNIEFKEFNKNRHQANDGVVDDLIFAEITKLKITEYTINNEDDLIRKIMEIATISKKLGYKLQKDYYQDPKNPASGVMTKEEALRQIVLSAGLFKAVLDYIGYYEK
jgi:hypothetical protein